MLTVDTTRYQPVADKIARKLHELLDVLVLVTNHEGVVVASNSTRNVGAPAHMILAAGETPALRVPVPFDCDRLTGEVIVEYPGPENPSSARLTRALVELVINQATVAEWLPTQVELRNKFIYDTLHGTIADPQVLLREGQILGMDLSQPRSVILVNASDYIHPGGSDGWTSDEPSQVRARQRSRFIIASIVGFFELPDDTICAYIGGGEIAVLKAISRQTLHRWSDNTMSSRANSWVDLTALRRAATALLKRLRNDTCASISMGIGRYHSGASGLTRSFSDARIALSVGNRYFGTGKVHSIDDLGMAAFVGGADEQTKLDLASHLLEPLDDEPELFHTLTTFFDEGCCLSTTASRLSIHRNTLGHRLHKITTLIGLDPREFDDAVQLRLALLMQSLPEQPS
jgi:carbohydrate diacid regulator